MNYRIKFFLRLLLLLIFLSSCKTKSSSPENIPEKVITPAPIVQIPSGKVAVNVLSVEIIPSGSIILLNDSIEIFSPQIPDYPGGYKNLEKGLLSSINYDQAIRKNKIEGELLATFNVTRTNPVLSNIVITGSPDISLNNEVMKAFENFSRERWKWRKALAVINNEEVKFTVSFKFKLDY